MALVVGAWFLTREVELLDIAGVPGESDIRDVGHGVLVVASEHVRRQG